MSFFRYTAQIKSYFVIPYVALAVSVFSFLLSGWVAYASHIGSPKPGLSVGRKLLFYPLPRMTADELNWGGVGFYLPITFHNRGPRGCSILELRMLIKPKSNPTRCFDISWTEFSEISTHEETLQRIWNTKSIAQPISIEGKSSVSKTVLFAWDPQTTENLKIQSGQYEITLLAWTDETAEADLKKSMTFRIDDDQVAEFRKYVEEDLPLTVEVPLGESRRDNSVITEEEAYQLYG